MCCYLVYTIRRRQSTSWTTVDETQTLVVVLLFTASQCISSSDMSAYKQDNVKHTARECSSSRVVVVETRECVLCRAIFTGLLQNYNHTFITKLANTFSLVSENGKIVQVGKTG